MTLIEQLKAWEQSMTKEEMDQAIAFVMHEGWNPGDQPPPYVWAAAYNSVAPLKNPANHGNPTP